MPEKPIPDIDRLVRGMASSCQRGASLAGPEVSDWQLARRGRHLESDEAMLAEQARNLQLTTDMLALALYLRQEADEQLRKALEASGPYPTFSAAAEALQDELRRLKRERGQLARALACDESVDLDEMLEEIQRRKEDCQSFERGYQQLRRWRQTVLATALKGHSYELLLVAIEAPVEGQGEAP